MDQVVSISPTETFEQPMIFQLPKQRRVEGSRRRGAAYQKVQINNIRKVLLVSKSGGEIIIQARLESTVSVC